MGKDDMKVGESMSNYGDLELPPAIKMYEITSRVNRSIEIPARNNMVKFMANERKVLPGYFVNDPAFQQQIKNFSVKEV